MENNFYGYIYSKCMLWKPLRSVHYETVTYLLSNVN